MDKYDVIIIGAGPGGLECARALQDSKLSILLVERNKEIGPKPCGGGITVAEKIVDIPDRYCKIFTREKFFLEDKCWDLPIKFTRKVFDRASLGKFQLNKLNKNKVIIKSGENVLKVDPNKITTDKSEYAFNYLVGADGSNSIVRKYLNLPIKFCSGIYYEIPGGFEELVSFYDSKKISSGYIWEFPHPSHNNVGIYFDPLYLKHPEAKKQLDLYIHKRGYKTEDAKLFSSIINYNYQGHQFGNIFLIGDAGGFASRLHGGGMNNAMTTGQEVAQKIINPNVETPGIQSILRSKKTEDRLLNIFYSLKFLQYTLLRLVILLLKLKIL